jgi:hypothetical protein
MPALNFKAQFVELILSGEKCQTIRKHRVKEINAGDKLYLYTGMRTKNCKKIAEAICTEAYYTHVSEAISENYAQRDGFKNAKECIDFFKKQYGDLPLDMRLIRWKIIIK